MSDRRKTRKGGSFDVRAYYQGVFGISNELDQSVEEVELLIGTLKANYIQSMPFYSSQKGLSEDLSDFGATASIRRSSHGQECL